MARPVADYWNEGTPPFLYPGLNLDREAIISYAEELTRQAQVNAQTGSYTIVASDAGKAIEVDSASDAVITIPDDPTDTIPIGAWVEIDRMGTGGVSIAAAPGVTIQSAGGFLTLRAQYSSATIRKRGTNLWFLVGDLVA